MTDVQSEKGKPLSEDKRLSLCLSFLHTMMKLTTVIYYGIQ